MNSSLSATEKKPRKLLQDRIKRVILICIFSSLIIYYLITLMFHQQITKDNLINEVTGITRLIGDRSIAALRFNDRLAASRNIASAATIPNIKRLCLYDQAGVIFSEYKHKDANTLSGCPAKNELPHIGLENIFKSDHIEIRMIIDEGDEHIGSILIDYGRDNLNSYQLKTFFVLLLSLLITSVIAIYFSKKQLHRNFKPLNELNSFTKNITHNPFEINPKEIESPYNDEVNDLIRSFSKMLETTFLEHNNLQKSENKFRSLSENSPIGIYVKSFPNGYSYSNKKWQEITGYNPKTSNKSFFDIIDPRDQQYYQQKINSAFKNQTHEVIEYRIKHPKSGQTKILMEYLSPTHEIIQNSSITGVVGSVLDVSELKETQQRLEHLAFHDPLTDLPNRRFFKDHLTSRIATTAKEHKHLSLLMIDLDNFKQINDTMGHDSGDLLLQIVGGRLRAQIFQEDVIARIGGDEFIILLEHNNSTLTTDRVGQRILSAITKPLTLNAQLIEISCSIGVARYPDDADNVSDLLRHADAALYQAKAKGKNRIDYYSKALNDEIQEKIQLEKKLKQAIANNTLEIYIQPQYNIEKSRFSSGEVLVRWLDESDGFISPDKFIPIAEESSIILELDQWVLRESFKFFSTEKARLNAIGIERLSINISAREFHDKQLLPTLKNLLKEFSLKASMLEFELTESMVMENVNGAIETMKELKQLGFKLSIDDFGTGYSSLSYLKLFNVDYLKIDKSFIDGLPDDNHDVAITGTILAMANKLGLGVIAEGIETQEQSQFLIQNGCQIMQGYYYARPMPTAELLALPKLDPSV